jgi:intracellular multiplication protein IcmL
MATDLGQLEEKRNNFYRDSYRKLLNFLVFLVWIGVVLAIVLGIMLYAPPQPKYYASTTSGNVIPLHSLSEPVITSDFVIKWASLVTLGVFNLNFDKVQSELAQQQPKFTSAGWDALQDALSSSNFLGSVTKNKLISSAVIDGSPVITVREIIHGRYTWVVQLPLLINFSSASEKSQEKLVITMTVMRVPVLGSAQGIQVAGFDAEKPI